MLYLETYPTNYKYSKLTLLNSYVSPTNLTLLNTGMSPTKIDMLQTEQYHIIDVYGNMSYQINTNAYRDVSSQYNIAVYRYGSYYCSIAVL